MLEGIQARMPQNNEIWTCLIVYRWGYLDTNLFHQKAICISLSSAFRIIISQLELWFTVRNLYLSLSIQGS